jgi:hypothetical protein
MKTKLHTHVQPFVKEEVKRYFKQYQYTTGKENNNIPNLWDAAKAVLR